jgi:hypothetical protein
MSGILISSIGKRYKYSYIEFWAERGLIHLLNFNKCSNQPNYTQCSVYDFLKRAQAFSQQNSGVHWTDERIKQQTLIENMLACCKEAKAQGNPYDPKTMEHVRNMRNKWYLNPGPDIKSTNHQKIEVVGFDQS